MSERQYLSQRILDSNLIDAVKRDDVAKVRKLLAEGANPSAVEVRSRFVFGVGNVKGACDSALIIAARKGTPESRELMQNLIKAGADASYINNWGESAATIIKSQLDLQCEFGLDGLFLNVLLAQLQSVSRKSGL